MYEFIVEIHEFIYFEILKKIQNNLKKIQNNLK